MANADGEALQRATDRIRERARARENPRSTIARFITDWRVIVLAALGLLGGGAWGYSKWSGVVKKPDLAGVATQADIAKAVAEHAAQPGHAEELRQHQEEQKQIQDIRGDVREVKGTVNTILQLMQNGAGRRR